MCHVSSHLLKEHSLGPVISQVSPFKRLFNAGMLSPQYHPDPATSWCQHTHVITHCPSPYKPGYCLALYGCICIMYDSMFSHSSSVVTAHRWRRATCFRNDACSTELGESWGCQWKAERESVQHACYCWLSRDSFNVSTCQVAICYTLSSHSIIRPGSPDGITYDKADTPPCTAKSLELGADL